MSCPFRKQKCREYHMVMIYGELLWQWTVTLSFTTLKMNVFDKLSNKVLKCNELQPGM